MTTHPATTTAVVDGPRKRRMGGGVACLALLGATLAALGHVAVQAQQLDLALALGNEVKQHHELVEQKRRLTTEIGRLKEPGKISATARDQLKMGPVDPNDIRVLGVGGGVSGRTGVSRVRPLGGERVEGSRLQAPGSGGSASGGRGAGKGRAVGVTVPRAPAPRPAAEAVKTPVPAAGDGAGLPRATPPPSAPKQEDESLEPGAWSRSVVSPDVSPPATGAQPAAKDSP